MDFCKIKNFIWDFDGTLYDTYPYTISCFIEALRKVGVDAEHEREHIYTLMMDTIPAAFCEYEERYSLGDRLRAAYGGIVKTDPFSQGGPFPYAAVVLKRVMQNGGKNYMFTHRVEDVYGLMEYWGTLEYFEDIVTLADGFAPKPSPEALEYLMSKHGFAKETAVMIGDRDIDIKSGANAGVHTCHITNRLPYRAFPVDMRVGGLEDIYDLLSRKSC